MPGKPKRRDDGTLKKGYTANPEGRGAGVDTLSKLQDAMKRVSKEKGLSLVEHFVRRAYRDDKVLKSLMKKLIPDLERVDSRILLQGGSDLDHLTDRQLDKKINQFIDVADVTDADVVDSMETIKAIKGKNAGSNKEKKNTKTNSPEKQKSKSKDGRSVVIKRKGN